MNQQQNQNQGHLQKQGYYMSQQHLKLMHLMHLSGYALQEYISNEIELNPVLEVEAETEIDEKDSNLDQEEDEFDSELLWSDDDLDEKTYKHNLANEDYYEVPIAQYNSLQENLKQQIQLMNISDEVREIACYIVDELDDDGYLRRVVSDVGDDYGFYSGKYIHDEQISEAISIVQKCEPAGIAAFDLRECLLLQLKRNSTSTCPIHRFSLKLLEEHYHSFAQRQYKKIKAVIGISNEDLEKCIQYISKLNPKPVSETNKHELMKEQIIPDFEVFIEGSELYVSLTSSESFKLKVNENYVATNIAISTNIEKKQVNGYFQNLISDANTLINALKERETTMINIMKEIVQMQPAFFNSGDIKELCPMILQDIAKKTGYDISTISRITCNKYVQTSFGIFCLKNLFMRAIPSSTEEVPPSTSIQIQDIIFHMVREEDKSCPLSDMDILKQLKEKDITIARRTVVKYREMVGIPNSTMRKKYEMAL